MRTSKKDFDELKSMQTNSEKFQHNFNEAQSIGLGYYRYLQLLAYCGSWERAKKLSVKKLIRIPGIGKQLAKRIAR